MRKEANTVCKYSGCTLGEDGGRKHYYACAYCAASERWKALACCREHYELYMKEVLEIREKEAKAFLAERTDMTEEEVKELKKKPLDQLEKEAKEELKEYADENGEVDIEEAVDKVNAELDKRRSKKKKSE